VAAKIARVRQTALPGHRCPYIAAGDDGHLSPFAGCDVIWTRSLNAALRSITRPEFSFTLELFQIFQAVGLYVVSCDEFCRLCFCGCGLSLVAGTISYCRANILATNRAPACARRPCPLTRLGFTLLVVSKDIGRLSILLARRIIMTPFTTATECPLIHTTRRPAGRSSSRRYVLCVGTQVHPSDSISLCCALSSTPLRRRDLLVSDSSSILNASQILW
jgi:hypothetical protein